MNAMEIAFGVFFIVLGILAGFGVVTLGNMVATWL